MSRQAASIRILLALALIFFVISMFNAFIAIKLLIVPTAKIITSIGRVVVCLKYGISLDINESFSMFEGDNFALYVNYTNPGNRTLVFSDNTSIFNINSSTGLINFTASVYDVGFNLNTDKLYFGTVMPGGSGKRAINIFHNYTYPIKVKIFITGYISNWVKADKTEFTVQPNETINVPFTVNVPKGTPYGNYTGKAKLVFARW